MKFPPRPLIKNKGKILKDVDGNLKPAQAWEDLTVNERMSIKSQFVNRNNPKQVNLRNLDILKDFLQEQYGITQTFPGSSPTKFKDQTLPGGEDYKELIFKYRQSDQKGFAKDIPVETRVTKSANLGL